VLPSYVVEVLRGTTVCLLVDLVRMVDSAVAAGCPQT
jgi:hypothetical protein